jgi:hypothetical protein
LLCGAPCLDAFVKSGAAHYNHSAKIKKFKIINSIEDAWASMENSFAQAIVNGQKNDG